MLKNSLNNMSKYQLDKFFLFNHKSKLFQLHAPNYRWYSNELPRLPVLFYYSQKHQFLKNIPTLIFRSP